MAIDALFEPFIGGLMIGAAASLLLWTNGSIAGVSGWLGGALFPDRGETAWRYYALLGLVLAGFAAMLVAPERIAASPRSLPMLALAGVLVGAGTRLGSGCTSGHGVCGVSRGSRRSMVATITFVATAVLTTLALRAWEVTP